MRERRLRLRMVTEVYIDMTIRSDEDDDSSPELTAEEMMRARRKASKAMIENEPVDWRIEEVMEIRRRRNREDEYDGLDEEED